MPLFLHERDLDAHKGPPRGSHQDFCDVLDRYLEGNADVAAGGSTGTGKGKGIGPANGSKYMRNPQGLKLSPRQVLSSVPQISIVTYSTCSLQQAHVLTISPISCMYVHLTPVFHVHLTPTIGRSVCTASRGQRRTCVTM